MKLDCVYTSSSIEKNPMEAKKKNSYHLLHGVFPIACFLVAYFLYAELQF
jgi:hypothetical protein